MTTNGMVTRARKKESMMKDQQELIEQIVGCHAFMSLSLDGLATSFHGTETLSPYTVRALDAAIFSFAMESYPRGFQVVDTSARHVAETILEERRVELDEPKLPWNALQLAAYHGSVGFTKTLLEHGADHDFSIPTPLSIAAFRGHVGVADALLAKGAGVNLVRPGPCPHVEFGDGLESISLPILAACGNKEMEHARVRDMFKLLIDGGADVNVATETGQTPLHLLVRPGDMEEGWEMGDLLEEKVDMLIARQADIDARDNDGDNPLHAAFKFGDGNNAIDVYALLIRHGANVNAQDRNGSTLLHLVLEHDSPVGHAAYNFDLDKVVDMLLRRGADETIGNNDGFTAEERMPQFVQNWKQRRRGGCAEYKEKETVVRTRKLLGRRRKWNLLMCIARHKRGQAQLSDAPNWTDSTPFAECFLGLLGHEGFLPAVVGYLS